MNTISSASDRVSAADEQRTNRNHDPHAKTEASPKRLGDGDETAGPEAR